MRAKFINKLNEIALSNVNLKDVLSKEFFKIFYGNEFNIEMLMFSYANDYAIDPNTLDIDEWQDSEDGKKYIEYSIEYRFSEVISMLDDVIRDDNSIIIWREIFVDENWLDHIEKQGNRLGIYWSYDKNAAEAHWGYDLKNKQIKVLLESKVNAEHINWIETIQQNMDFSMEEEKEIRLYKNTLLKINNIYIDGEIINIEKIKNKIFRA